MGSRGVYSIHGLIRRLTFEVGVHIADVSYFVQPGSPLDAEAFERATSTYLVDRVIPMLPRLLCEHLCSLNPGVAFLFFLHLLSDARVMCKFNQ